MNTTPTMTSNAITETVIPNGLEITSEGKIKKPLTFINILKPYVEEEGYKLKRLDYNKQGLSYKAELSMP